VVGGLAPGVAVSGRWAVFFDRDGVLTEATLRDGKPASPRSMAELVILPGAAEAVRAVHEGGGLAIVVTNQPDVDRGLLPPLELDRMNTELREVLGVDDVVACVHGGSEGCECRKPGPGLLLGAAAIHGIDLARSWMVGDRWVDVAAGAAAGVSTMLLDRPYSWDRTSTHAPPPGLRPTATCDTLAEAVGWVTRPPESVASCS
jgi:D-glycero-D-manno-heptose 1,7-bisphosphate phosphatase